jgi:hypothetical protein
MMPPNEENTPDEMGGKPPEKKDGAEHHPLTEHEAQALGAALNGCLQLEAKRFALDEAVGRIEKRQAAYDILGALLAVWLLFVLWGIRLLFPPGHFQEWADRVATFGGTGLSLAVLSLSLWSWRGEWGAQADRKRELAREARSLVAEFEEVRHEPKFDLKKLDKWKRKLNEFESRMSERLARVPARCLQLGHQHVGIRHHQERPIICQACGRPWEPRFAQLSRTWRSRWWGCRGCGVQQGARAGRSS